MSIFKKLSSKKKKPEHPRNHAQEEVLQKLGLEAYQTTPLDFACMLDVSTWALGNQAPLEPKALPKAFLQRLWLLRQDARSPCCQPQDNDIPNDDNNPPGKVLSSFEGDSQCAINPLDLITAVFMSASTFLQQEITSRMMQCQFSVPLILPNIGPEEPSHFLLWPLRGVVGQWRSHALDKYRKIQEGNLASTSMPLVSFVRLGHCSVSKSQVINHLLSGLTSCSEIFLHRGMDGGQLPRRLSNGLVEIGWYLPTGDITRDIFPVPLAISNLRGDASAHEKCLILLCQASSAVVIFCGNLQEKEKQCLASCKPIASKLILVDLSDTERNENTDAEFVNQNLEEHMGLPKESVVQGKGLSEETLAYKLYDMLKNLLPDRLKLVTLEVASKLAVDIGLNVDEGPVCHKAMATAEEVLKGLDEGSAKYRQKQLPLQGALCSKLAELEKVVSKQRKEGKEIDPQLQKEKKDILAELSSYKMTPAMKIFTDALFTADKVERTYFLNWLTLRLKMVQAEKQNSTQDLLTNLQKENKDGTLEHGLNDNPIGGDNFCSDSTFEEETKIQSVNMESQVHQQQCERGQQSTEKTTEPLSQQKESLEHIPDPAIVQESTVASNEKDVIIHSVSEDQSCHLEYGKKGTLRFPEKKLNKSDLTLQDSTSGPKQTSPDDPSEHHVFSCSQSYEPDPSSLSLEHFLREMGLIFELTHINPGIGSHNVLRLPSLATDLLLCGIPLELMDGDASNIPVLWLDCVFAELKHRLPQEQCRTRVLTSLGVYHARNAEVLSALFGVKFPEQNKRSTKGVYMVALSLPDNLRNDMESDFLLLIDVEGLCSSPLENKRNVLLHDNEMATFAAGLSDVLMQNISSHADDEFERNFTVIVNSLLRIKECGSMPVCQLFVQDEGINSILQASQLRHVSDMLQTENGGRQTSNIDKHEKTTSCTMCVKGPWSKMSLSEPVDTQYSRALLNLKENLFEALKRSAAKSEASGLPEFMKRVHAIWDAVKEDSFSTGLQNTDIALTFSLLCTEFSQWEKIILENIERWLIAAANEIVAPNAEAFDASTQNDLLSDLKKEAREQVKTEVNKLKSKVEAYMIEEEPLKKRDETFRPILMSKIGSLQDIVTEEIMQKLETVNESHCFSTQLKKFETSLKKEQESKLDALVEKSKTTNILLQDTELEEEFEDVWNKILSNFEFRPSEREEITPRVTDILRENLISHGLQKHMKKLDMIGQSHMSGFQVCDEHFGYRSRLKYVFENTYRLQKLEAQQVAHNIIEECNQFIADKCSLPADFSDSYIIDMLESIEKVLREKSMEIRSAFEADLKVYLCNAACQDFQKLHDRYAKDRDLLIYINGTKGMYLSEFIYRFRKRDQCQRMTQAFISMVIKPTVMDYINRPLGMYIVEEIQGKAQQYQSPQAFHQSLLEEMIKEDRFESFLEYLLSYDNFRVRKIQEAVMTHHLESTSLDKWKQQRLEEIVEKIAAAINQMAEGTSGVLSDTKPLLEKVCLILERDGDVDAMRASLTGPLFSIATEWDSFVKCFKELLTTMQTDLDQEFSKNVDIIQTLNCLPVQPQEYLFNRVKGCDKQCPLCRAPCEENTMGHEVHKAVLHRPKGLMPNDSSSLSCISCPDIMTQNKDTHDISTTCKDLHSLYPDWNISPENPNSDYWRYVLARFNEQFAKEFKEEPQKIPEEWRGITQKQALNSLKDAFLTKPCC